jgi:hypothetical protein
LVSSLIVQSSCGLHRTAYTHLALYSFVPPVGRADLEPSCVSCVRSCRALCLRTTLTTAASWPKSCRRGEWGLSGAGLKSPSPAPLNNHPTPQTDRRGAPPAQQVWPRAAAASASRAINTATGRHRATTRHPVSTRPPSHQRSRRPMERGKTTMWDSRGLP